MNTEKDSKGGRESAVQGGLAQVVIDGVDSEQEAQSQRESPEGRSLLAKEKERKRRGRPRKGGQGVSIVGYLTKPGDAFAAKREIARTPTKELRSRSVPVGTSRTGPSPEDSEKEDDPKPTGGGKGKDTSLTRSVSEEGVTQTGTGTKDGGKTQGGLRPLR